MQQLLAGSKSITCDYDELQDMLYILFEPVTGATFYEDVPEMPGVMRRFSADDEHFVELTVHDVAGRPPTDIAQEAAIRELAQALVEQLE